MQVFSLCSVPPATNLPPEATRSQKLAKTGWAPTPAASAFLGGGAGERGAGITCAGAVAKSHRYEPDHQPPATANLAEQLRRGGGAGAGHVSRAEQAKAEVGVQVVLSAGYSPPCATVSSSSLDESTAPNRGVCWSELISDRFPQTAGSRNRLRQPGSNPAAARCPEQP